MGKFTRWPQSNLPIYSTPLEEGSLFYSPGYLLYSREPNFKTTFSSPFIQKLFSHAKYADQQWRTREEITFQPFSLHIYLTRDCNLSCLYCFSAPHSANPKYQSATSRAIYAAALLVANKCKDENKPMTLVCHGGGEPTQDSRLKTIVDDIQQICAEINIQLFTYLATNGVLESAQAQRICKIFDLVGLSCDGPPEIQNLQRPTKNGKPSSTVLENTVKIFHHHEQPFEVRVTLTANSWPRLPEIANYLIDVIRPKQINVELAYLTSNPTIIQDQYDEYIDLYLKAKTLCEQNDIVWQSSAVRPGQIHTRYCHLLDNTFQILPGDVASICFLDNDCKESLFHQTTIADYEKKKDRWIYQPNQLELLTQQLSHIPDYCNDCLLFYHCSRACPEQCPLRENTLSPNDRCELNSQLFTALLHSYGKQLMIKCSDNHLLSSGMEISSC